MVEQPSREELIASAARIRCEYKNTSDPQVMRALKEQYVAIDRQLDCAQTAEGGDSSGREGDGDGPSSSEGVLHRAKRFVSAVQRFCGLVAKELGRIAIRLHGTWEKEHLRREEAREEARRLLLEEAHAEAERKRLCDLRIVCPQCRERGYVTTERMVNVKTETSMVGIFAETREIERAPYTEAHCFNCDSTWRF